MCLSSGKCSSINTAIIIVFKVCLFINELCHDSRFQSMFLVLPWIILQFFFLLKHVLWFTTCLSLKLWYLIIVGMFPYNFVISLESCKSSSLLFHMSIFFPSSHSLIVIVLGLIAFCVFRDLFYKPPSRISSNMHEVIFMIPGPIN